MAFRWRRTWGTCPPGTDGDCHGFPVPRPATLYPGSTTPARPGETAVLYANGFGPTATPVVGGSLLQSRVLSPPPVIGTAGTSATVQFAGLVSPGESQFNVVVPDNTPAGALLFALLSQAL